MNEKRLDEVLNEYRAQCAPPLPGSFAQDVFREVRLRSTQPKIGWLADLISTGLRPTTLAASFLLALAVGATLPVLARDSNPDSNPELAITSLNLNVFSSTSAEIPSGLLSRRP